MLIIIIYTMKQTVTNKITFIRDYNMPDDRIDSIKHQVWASKISLFRAPFKWVKEVTNEFAYIKHKKQEKTHKTGFVK